jgi:translocation and assembly module TamA
MVPCVLLAAPPVTLTIEGLEGRPLENVRAALALPPGIVRTDNTVDEAWLERFTQGIPEKVEEALQPFGYYRSKVSTELLRPEGSYSINVAVEPGEPILVTSVKVSLEGKGAEEKALKSLADLFPIKKGEILLHEKYSRAKEDLLSAARNLGYLDADFPVHAVFVNISEGRADIELALNTGRRYFFNGITFSGTSNYPEKFLRRFLTFRSGDVFSYPALSDTQTNLYNSDRFRQVFLETDKEKAKDGHVPVNIRLEPSPTKRFRAGVGYGTDTGARISSRYLDVNVLDRGHEFEAGIDISERIQAAVGRYTIPTGRSLYGFYSLRLLFERQDVFAYESRSTNLEVSREWRIKRQMFASVYTRFIYEWYEVGEQRTTSFVLMPGARIWGSTFDNPIRPRKGYRYLFEARGTDPALGSSVNFLQLINETEFVIPLPARFSIHGRTRIATTLQTDSLQDIPVTLRFFAGGDRSVRGYRYQSLGPTDASGRVVGGRNLFVGNIELERALRENWGVAVFYDAGNALNDFSSLNLFQSAGIGVRYYSPVGPIRLDVARQINVPDPGFRIHLTIGFGI